jgi:hypothetical protein
MYTKALIYSQSVLVYWCTVMNGKSILEVASPVTQTAEAVKQLIAFVNHGQEPAELPDFFRLSETVVLVQSAQKDAYYVTTAKGCSCPSATYRPGRTCKHQRKYLGMKDAPRAPAELLKRGRLSKPPEDLVPGKWAGGHNGPVHVEEVA